jgi:FkbM family methyltransferase
MTRRTDVRATLRRCLPRRLRVELDRLRRVGAQGYTRNKWRQHSKRGGPEPRANAPFDIGAPVPIVLHDSTVSGVKSHWVDRGHGTRELDAFRRLAPGHSTFLDIGAAAGIFSAAFCALTDGRAYALEPSPVMFERLTALIDLNPEFEITPCKTAFSSMAGTQFMQLHGAQFRGISSADASSKPIPTETLDDFVARRKLTPDFAKVDVEGMELEVLRGGAETFGGSIDTMILEIHPRRILMRGEAVSDIQSLLDGFGFRLLTLDSTPIPDLARHVAGRHRQPPRAINVVCQKSPSPGA